MAASTKIQKKSLDSPDETRTFEKGKIELVNLGDVTIGRAVLEPGWSWEKSVKPTVAYSVHSLWSYESCDG
jgi:hypothetical protein